MRFWVIYILASTLILLSCAPSISEGEYIYNNNCLNCHQENGQGVGTLIPPLDGTFLIENHDRLPCIVRDGIWGELTIEGETYNQPMPENHILTDTEIANVLNYVNKKWGDKKSTYTIEEVQVLLNNCVSK